VALPPPRWRSLPGSRCFHFSRQAGGSPLGHNGFWNIPHLSRKGAVRAPFLFEFDSWPELNEACRKDPVRPPETSRRVANLCNKLQELSVLTALWCLAASAPVTQGTLEWLLFGGRSAFVYNKLQIFSVLTTFEIGLRWLY